MKLTPFFIAFILIYFNSYGQKQNPFVISRYNYTVSEKISSVSFYNNSFHCFLKNGDYLIIDSLKNLVEPQKENKLCEKDSSNIRFLKKKRVDSLMNSTSRQNSNQIFEDDEFIVTKTCSGEWGGTIYFYDKLSEKTFECAASCVVDFDTLNGNYIVSSSIGHMDGSTVIMEIQNPRKLQETKKVKQKKLLTLIGDNECKTMKGANILLEERNYLTISSFIYQKSVYHIIHKPWKFKNFVDNTFLGQIQNDSLSIIANISHKDYVYYWDFESVTNNNFSNKEYILDIFFAESLLNSNTLTGFVFIKGNKVEIYELNIE